METERLVLFLPSVDDAHRVTAYRRRTRERSAPWDPQRPDAFFTDAYWRTQLQSNFDDAAAGHAVRFHFAHRRDAEGEIIGHVSLSQIFRGPFLNAYVGYAIDGENAGCGLATESVGGAIAYAFETLGLHRIQANVIPSNSASLRLLERLGFRREGLAKDYLRIHGEWCDHVLTALTSSDWEAQGR